MKKLKFDDKYLGRILSGHKTTTLRLGRKEEYSPGDIVEVYVGDNFIGLAKIKDVRYVKWNELTDEEIIKDGFSSKNELKRDLIQYYGNFSDDAEFTLIEFELI
ncbi:MAG TPA: ASCH domain-containing protein [Thermoprotei archaeon]|nr:MAG: ASCH domain-containing protein [Thermoplasmata archaeon]HDJ50788.1 ASCH domain-containing protein [Thermoprotei archaeon]